jgi:hypothetical protein
MAARLAAVFFSSTPVLPAIGVSISPALMLLTRIAVLQIVGLAPRERGYRRLGAAVEGDRAAVRD